MGGPYHTCVLVGHGDACLAGPVISSGISEPACMLVFGEMTRPVFYSKVTTEGLLKPQQNIET
jgi:hypothetical protein